MALSLIQTANALSKLFQFIFSHPLAGSSCDTLPKDRKIEDRKMSATCLLVDGVLTAQGVANKSVKSDTDLRR